MSLTQSRIKYICRLGYGDALPKDHDSSGNIDVYGSNGPYDTFPNPNTASPAIILGRKGSYGKINWAPNGCFASDTTFFIDEKCTKDNLRWIYWVLHSLNLDKGSQEAAVPGLNRETVYEKRVFRPHIEIQKVIAQYLDQETARIDALVAEKEQMLALLEDKRTALISRAVTRGLNPNVVFKPSGLDWLGEVPEHWQIMPLKYLAQVRGGLTLGKKYSTNNLIEIPYLRVANVQDGYLKLDDIQTVEVPSSEIESGLLEHGDVLMNEGGDIDKLGRGCVWRDEIKPCLHQNHVFSVRPRKVNSEWLALWTSTIEAKRYFEQRAKRSTNLASISGTNIKEFPVILPPNDEQEAIKQYIEKMSSHLSTIRAEMAESIQLLKERRSALITAAVTGQLSMEEMQHEAQNP